MSIEEISAEIRRLGPWHHDVEVVPGLWTGAVTRDVVYPSSFGAASVIRPDVHLDQVVDSLFPEGLAGRSFLDCACNGGGYLFAAARRGAGRCFGFDIREHWIEQARFLARHLPGAVELAALDIHALPGLGLEPFDVTLFKGIFYHLPDPVACLRTVADLTNELLVLNTAFVPREGNVLTAVAESTTDVMSGAHGLAWLPSGEPVLRDILRWCGFPHARLNYRLEPANGQYGRLELLAARSESTFAHFDTLRPPVAPPRPGLIRRLLRR